MIEQIGSLLKTRKYMYWMIVCFLLGYAFFFSYISVYIDDSATGRYLTEGRMLRQGRWGIWLIANLLRQTEYTPFLYKALGILLLFFSCIVVCALFRSVSGNKVSLRTLVAFSCIMGTYSLINEILFYVSSQRMVGFIYIFSTISVWWLMKGITKNNVLRAVIFLTLGLAISEAAAGVYIILVVGCMLLQDYYRPTQTTKLIEYIKLGSVFCGTLLAAIALQKILARFFCLITGWDLQARTLLWFNSDSLYVLKNLLNTTVINYGIRAIFYFPIAEFLLCFVANTFIILWYVFKKKWSRAFLWSVFALSSVVFSIIQGEASPNRAIWQIFSIYVAFHIAMIYETVCRTVREKRGILMSTILVSMIVVWQIYDLNTWGYVDYMRNYEEASVVNDLGRELQQGYNVEEKPVVFVGKYQLSNNILQYTHVKYGSEKYILAQKIISLLPGNIAYQRQYLDEYGYQFNETGSNSVITWGVYAFQETNTELLKIFAYYGYVFTQGTDGMYAQGQVMAENMPHWPEEGSIIDMGDYILVNFGL